MNRRKFFHRSASAAALSSVWLSGLPAFSAEAKKHKMTINLVCGAIGVTAKTQQEVNALAHRHGFESVEARPHDLAAMSAEELVTLREDMAQMKLVFGASSLPVDFRKDDATFRAGIKELPKLAAGLQRAGVDRISTWLSPSHDRLTYIANFNQHVLRLKEVATICKDHGLRFGLEYVGTQRSLVNRKFPFVHTMAETLELIDFIGTGNVGLVLDAWHWWMAGDSADDIRALKKEQVVAVDLNDAPIGLRKGEHYDGKRELPSATGVIDLRSFLNALNQIGYDGPVRAEPFNAKLRAMDNDAACAATIKALREFMDLVW